MMTKPMPGTPDDAESASQLPSFPVTHSLLAAEALRGEVARSYPVARPVDCTLYRSYANDVYLVTTAEGQRILKVYRASWRSVEEIAYEVELLAHLAAKGVRVATAVRRNDGGVLGTLRAPEGARHYVLYSYADGIKPRQPFTTDLYRRFGRATALVHRASDDFVSPHRRTPLDLVHFLDRPLAALRPWLAGRPDDWYFLVSVAEKVRQRITTLAPDLDWGPCHGDLSLDNLHITASGDIIFYDFDSGGPGWRASDPYGVYRYAASGVESLWPAFLQGYRSARPFGAADLAAVPYFAAAYAVEGMGHQAANWVTWGGRWLMSDNYLDKELANLRRWDNEQLSSCCSCQ
jgi:Ser/Thr protein kinase RdoA (MazF antagonist)